jgi:hypothetical protein
MTSQATRDPLADHLITPQIAAFVLIDYHSTANVASGQVEPTRACRKKTIP